MAMKRISKKSISTFAPGYAPEYTTLPTTTKRFFPLALDGPAGYLPSMPHKKIIWAGLAAGVLCHIMQGFGAYLIFDRLYLQNAELVRDAGRIVGVIYLILNLGIGVVIAYLTWYLQKLWKGTDWQVGLKTGLKIGRAHV
jgi:hypothetical protein